MIPLHSSNQVQETEMLNVNDSRNQPFAEAAGALLRSGLHSPTGGGGEFV